MTEQGTQQGTCVVLRVSLGSKPRMTRVLILLPRSTPHGSVVINKPLDIGNIFTLPYASVCRPYSVYYSTLYAVMLIERRRPPKKHLYILSESASWKCWSSPPDASRCITMCILRAHDGEAPVKVMRTLNFLRQAFADSFPIVGLSHCSVFICHFFYCRIVVYWSRRKLKLPEIPCRVVDRTKKITRKLQWLRG